jgi:hypothetical protein
VGHVVVQADGSVEIEGDAARLAQGEGPPGCCCGAVAWVALIPCTYSPDPSVFCPPQERDRLYVPTDHPAFTVGPTSSQRDQTLRYQGACYRTVTYVCATPPCDLRLSDGTLVGTYAAPQGVALTRDANLEPVLGCDDPRCDTGLRYRPARLCGGRAGPVLWVCSSRVGSFRWPRFGPNPDCYCVDTSVDPVPEASLPPGATRYTPPQEWMYPDCCDCLGDAPLATCLTALRDRGDGSWERCCCGGRATRRVFAAVSGWLELRPVGGLVDRIEVEGSATGPVGADCVDVPVRFMQIVGSDPPQVSWATYAACTECGSSQSVEPLISLLRAGMLQVQSEFVRTISTCLGRESTYEQTWSDEHGVQSVRVTATVTIVQPEPTPESPDPCSGCEDPTRLQAGASPEEWLLDVLRMP